MNVKGYLYSINGIIEQMFLFERVIEMKINKQMKQVGNIKDRGSTKWQGMFLTEHVQMLREWREEDKLVPKPDLDEWDLQYIQEELEIAMKRKCEVRIQSWKDGKYHYHKGTIEAMDINSKTVVYDDPFGLHRLPVEEITAINLLD